MKNISMITLGVSAIWLVGCAQPPAPVAHKGDRFYGKNGSVQMAQAPTYGQQSGFVAESLPPTQKVAAPIARMEVAELPAPAPTVQPRLAFKTTSARYEAPKPALAKPQLQMIDVEAPQLEPLAMETLSQPAIEPQNPIVKAALEPSSKASARASNFIWPTEGKIVSRFGPKKNGLVNDGINIASVEGEPIWSAASGEVVYAGNELKGYGNMMIVRHSNGWMTAYAHASDMLVNKGDRVSQGDLIGYVGKTGAVNSAQLHFGIRDGKTPIDPESLLPRRVASAQ